METKKIFVLGNGFDLAHYLPTAYIHFMEAMQVVENSHTSSELGFDDLFKSRLDNEDWFLFRTKELYKTDDLILTAEIVDDLREKLKQNGWFQHFKHHLADVDTWIDFETEIENVLRDFSLVFNTAFDTGTVRQHYYNDEEKLAKLQVSKESEVLFNERFFQQFGIKSNKIFPLFFTFNLFRNGYVLREHDRWGDFIDYKILENENDYKNADVRYKHEFKNIIDSYYLKRIGNIFTSFYEDKIFKMLAKQLEEFSKIFELYISNLVNKLNPIKPFPSFEKINDNIELVFTFNYSERFKKIVNDVQEGMNKYFRGQAVVAFCVGILFSIGFLIIDFPLAIGFGLFIGLLNMVPYLQLIAFIPTILLALLKAADTGENFWWILFCAFLVFCIVQVIQDGLIVPKVMGKITGLNPAIILLSLSVWGALMGIVGMIIALPCTSLMLSYYQRYIHIKEKEFSSDNNTPDNQ